MKRDDYIPSPQHWKEMYTQHSYWTSVDKVRISSIKIDKRFFAYPNPVYQSHVRDIVDNFDPELWIPVMVNEDFYLLDGQHRLEAAKKKGLKYLDVVIKSKDLP